MARPRPPSLGVRRGALVLVVSCLGGCDGGFVNLGASSPLSVGGDAGAAGSSAGGVTGGSGSGREWIPVLEPLIGEEGYLVTTPTLTSDGELLSFSRQKISEPDAHAWLATKSGSIFEPPDYDADPLPLAEDEQTGIASPALSADGKELWFGMTTPGSLSATDIWLARQEGDGWAAPELVSELGSDGDDAPRPPGQDGLVMPLASRPPESDRWQIYFATRAAVGAVWSAPSRDHLSAVNAEGTSTSDGFLSHDGLTLYFAMRRGESLAADLYRASRATIDSDFSEPEALDGLQSEGTDERDPWLGSDGWLYYTSNRSGDYAIHRARRTR